MGILPTKSGSASAPWNSRFVCETAITLSGHMLVAFRRHCDAISYMKFNPLTNVSRLLLLVLGFENSSNANADALSEWQLRTSGTSANIKAVAHGNGRFVAVGDSGLILTSLNGTNWTSISAGQPTTKLCVTFGNGYFLGAGQVWLGTPTNIVVSSDGTNWFGLHPSTAATISGAIYAKGTYMLVGSDMTILTATNLDLGCAGQLTNCNWTVKVSGGNTSLHGVAYGNEVFVAVGDSQLSVTSTNSDTWTTNNVPQGFFGMSHLEMASLSEWAVVCSHPQMALLGLGEVLRERLF
jgi:hypothetical protein